MWKKIKNNIRKIIGEKNSQRIALIQAASPFYVNRCVRSLKECFLPVKEGLLTPEKYAVEGKQTFFGYYDISPFSDDNNKVLAMEASNEIAPPTKGGGIRVGYFDIGNNKVFHEVGKTTTWCWQQGCRLQWLPCDGGEQLIIYNCIVDEAYGAIVKNVTSKEIIKKYSFPIYSVDDKGKWAVSLNFSRLHRLRPGYGYVGLEDITASDMCPKDDGIWLINMESGGKELIIDLYSLAHSNPLATMDNAEHYINHLAFNPDGNRFMFFHLWTRNGKRYNRLYVCNRNGKNLTMLSEDGLVSHYDWKNNDELLVTVNFTGQDSRYRLYDIDTGGYKIFEGDSFKQDGHPSYSQDGARILVDTYPDSYGEQHLFIYDFNKGLRNLARFLSSPWYRGEIRCDLHPRWNNNNEMICFDSTHEGRRALYILKLT